MKTSFTHISRRRLIAQDLTTVHRIERLERLLELSRQISSSLETESLLRDLIDAVCELTDSEASAVLLYEEDTDLLKVIASTRVKKEALARLRIPLHKTIAGKVYTDCKPLAILPSADRSKLREADHILGTEVRSLLAVPMVFRGESIGVIEAANRRKDCYTQDDITLLEALTAQASNTILSTLMLDEMKHAYTRLEESERKKSDFIAIASHELRTPLGLILGHASFLYDSCADKDIRPQLEVILKSASRMKKIMEDFAKVSEEAAPENLTHKRKVGMVHLVRETASTFQQTARNKGLSLGLRLPQYEMNVEGDPERLRLVISNLLENALSFTDRGGHIIVTADKLPGYAKVSVIDDGIGIPAEDLQKIFERFYQVEGHLTRRHGGMGLGLSVAKAMVELHNGQIWVESVEGKGSNFSFLLPLMEADTTGRTPAFVAGVKPFE